MSNAHKLAEHILHEGIFTYKPIGSSAPLPDHVQKMKLEKKRKNGSVFIVHDKSCFNQSNGHVKGLVVNSLETVNQHVNKATHWTPNIYNYGTYSDKGKKHIKGHTETNLQQINAFVIDVDSNKQSPYDIWFAAEEMLPGTPTAIIKSQNGYHLYFVLDSPVFISNKNNYKVLKIAKRISRNLRAALAEKVSNVDEGCNDFGFFVMPSDSNVLFYDQSVTFDFHQLIQFSMSVDSKKKLTLFPQKSRLNNERLTESEWFSAIINSTHIKGAKSQLGRNNAVLTLSLACKADGMTEEDTYNILDQFNSNLENPLCDKELRQVIKNAFNKRYKGPGQKYVSMLLETYTERKGIAGSRIWYKFKKQRKDRSRSHYVEWETDILQYVHSKIEKGHTFIWSTQKELSEEIGIPLSSFKEVIKRSEKVILRVVGRGRYARTAISTVAVLFQYAMNKKADKRDAYDKWLKTVIKGVDAVSKKAVHKLFDLLNAEKAVKDGPIINTS